MGNFCLPTPGSYSVYGCVRDTNVFTTKPGQNTSCVHQCSSSNLFKVQTFSELRHLFLLVGEFGQKSLQEEKKNRKISSNV